MKYRLKVDLIFDSEEDRDKALNLMKPYLAKAKDLNTGKSNEEKSHIHYHKCMHDEGKPCEDEHTLYIDDVKQVIKEGKI